MKLIRIDHTPQGGSRFSDHDWELVAGDFTPPSPSGCFTSREIPAISMMVMHHPAGYQDKWQNEQ